MFEIIILQSSGWHRQIFIHEQTARNYMDGLRRNPNDFVCAVCYAPAGAAVQPFDVAQGNYLEHVPE